MKTTCLTIIITIIPLLSFGQQKKQAKCEAVAKELVGSWKFDYAMYGDPIFKGARRIESDVFHTDTIHFFSDMTFEFKTHDTEYTDIRTVMGNWEIREKGKTLVHMNTRFEPPLEVTQFPEVTFPVKLMNFNRIRIDYTFHVADSTFGNFTDIAPIYFSRIAKYP